MPLAIEDRVDTFKLLLLPTPHSDQKALDCDTELEYDLYCNYSGG